MFIYPYSARKTESPSQEYIYCGRMRSKGGGGSFFNYLYGCGGSLICARVECGEKPDTYEKPALLKHSISQTSIHHCQGLRFCGGGRREGERSGGGMVLPREPKGCGDLDEKTIEGGGIFVRDLRSSICG